MKEYVVGFIFNEDVDEVLLIRKTHPEWQKGLLNGVGGKVEDGETPLVAMHREWEEEVGISAFDWRLFLTLFFPHSVIHFYVATGGVSIVLANPPTEERPEIFRLTDLLFSTDLVYNLRATLPLAMDFLKHLRQYHSAPNTLEIRR
jgi:8-oxo-dGTP diphosphatase